MRHAVWRGGIDLDCRCTPARSTIRIDRRSDRRVALRCVRNPDAQRVEARAGDGVMNRRALESVDHGLLAEAAHRKPSSSLWNDRRGTLAVVDRRRARVDMSCATAVHDRSDNLSF
jgi:hypothetical protein